MSSIIALIAEFFLIKEDYKHRKRVKEEEKKDGVKRPFKKYFYQPGTIVILTALLITGVLSIYLNVKKNPIQAQRTLAEMSEISKALHGWHSQFGSFPDNLNQLVKARPLRAQWLNDSWHRPYIYVKGISSFQLLSAGPDGEFYTQDDILTK